MTPDLTSLSLLQLAKLHDDIGAVMEQARCMADMGHAPKIDLTGPALLSVPLFPRAAPTHFCADCCTPCGPHDDGVCVCCMEARIAASAPPLAAATAGEDRAGGVVAPPAAETVAVITAAPGPVPFAEVGAILARNVVVDVLATNPVDAQTGAKVSDKPAPVSKWNNAWTEAEDAMIVQECGTFPHDSATAIGKRLSRVLGRTPAAIAFRMANALKARIEEARAAKPVAVAPVVEPVPVAPVAAPVTPVADAAPAAPPVTKLAALDVTALTPRQRPIAFALRALGYAAPWNATLDLWLCESLWRGEKLPAIAADMGVDTDAVKGRFRRLRDAASGGDMLTIDAQKDLLAVLRANAARKDEAAA